MEVLTLKHEVGVVCFRVPGVDEATAEYLRRHIRFYEEIPLRLGQWKTLFLRCKSLVTAMPLEALFYRDKAMENAIRSAMTRFRPDVVILQFPQMAQYVETLMGIPCVMDVQDAFSVSFFRAFASQVGFIRKVNGFLNWLFWIRYERRYYPRFAMVLTLTEQDLNGLRIFSPDIVGASIGVPVSICSLPENVARDPFRVVFIGSFGHRPNIQGVRFFIEEVLPLVRHRVPEVKFVVAGKAPPPELMRLASDHVQFVGFVPDAATFLTESAVVVIPLLSGGGIKIKTLEALATGAPVVSTSIGVEGTGAVNEEHLLVRDKVSGFADAVVDLIMDPVRASKLGEAGKSLMRQCFLPEAWGNHLDVLLASTCREKPGLDVSK
jgi:glycosyltransferase involved in cell wall biosynthesis